MVDDAPEKNRTGVREAMNGQQTLTWHGALSYDLWFFVKHDRQNYQSTPPTTSAMM